MTTATMSHDAFLRVLRLRNQVGREMQELARDGKQDTAEFRARIRWLEQLNARLEQAGCFDNRELYDGE